MKRSLFFASIPFIATSQVTIGFESFSLAPNSAYSSTASAPFTVSGATFNHEHAFNLWLGGFSYTNKYDSTDGTFNNLHGVKAYKGRNQSDVYTMGQSRGVISLGVAQTTVGGFYVTNSTYAYNTIRDGDMFSRKFGDTTGTGSGTTIPQGAYPDYFKLVVRGYHGGLLKSDSVTFFLADYRGTNDYIVDTWEFVNTASLGAVDSLVFTLRSSDNGQYGMNTPAFFAIDDVMLTLPNPVGFAADEPRKLSVWPNPFSSTIHFSAQSRATLTDATGRILRQLEAGSCLKGLEDLPAGIYFLHLDGDGEAIRVVRQ